MSRNKLLTLIFPAFGAALITILSQIVILIGTVPFTLSKTLAVGAYCFDLPVHVKPRSVWRFI